MSEDSRLNKKAAHVQDEAAGRLAYVGPFVVFLLLLAFDKQLVALGSWEYALRVLILTASLWFFSRRVLDLRVKAVAGSVALGVVVFLLWIGPDALFPQYRQHWLFSNSLTGTPASSIPAGFLISPLVLVFRSIRATLLVPMIEELFWRAWLLRWIINPQFQKVPLGTYSSKAMWISALLFASEHGSYWEVGLLAGLLYNWWMVRTKSLGDCILAHGVTNGLLCVYVIAGKHWQYWL